MRAHIVTLPAVLSGRISIPTVKKPSIWFLGTSREALLGLEQHLPEEALGSMGTHLDTALSRVTQQLIELEDQLDLKGRTDLWDSGDTAQNSQYCSRLIHEICWTITARDLAREGHAPLLVVEDDSFGQALAIILRQADITVTLEGYGIVKGRLSSVCKTSAVWTGALRARLGGLWRFYRQRRKLRERRNSRPIPWHGVHQARVLMAVWSDARTFPNDGPKKHDAYFGPLSGILQNAGHHIAYLTLPMDWVESFDAIAEAALESPEPVIFPHDLLTTGHMLNCAFRTLFASKPQGLVVVEGMDMTPLLRRALDHDKKQWRPSQALAFADLPLILKAHGVIPDVLIHPFENQPWEKLLNRGARHTWPTCFRVGSLNALPPESLISIHPSKGAQRRNAAPDIIVTPGPALNRRMAARGWPKERLRIGGALRHAGLLQTDVSLKNKLSERNVRILACCDIGYEDSLDLAITALKACASFETISLTVNFHPVMPSVLRKRIEDLSRKAMPEITCTAHFTDAPASHLLRETDVVLYAGAGSVIEALALGVEVVFVHNTTGFCNDRLAHDTPIKRFNSCNQLSAFLEGRVYEKAFFRTGSDRKALLDLLGEIDKNAWLALMPPQRNDLTSSLRKIRHHPQQGEKSDHSGLK